VAYFEENYLKWVPSLKAEKYVTKQFPPAFVMTARNDYLRVMGRPMHLLLKCKGVESVFRLYGKKEQKEIGHVFHLNCHTKLADWCNDEEAAFFRKHIV
jgi:acetyl esterase/lipase